MIEVSLLDKLKMFIDAVISSPLYLTSIILGVLLIIIVILDVLIFKKMHRYMYIICWTIVFILFIVKYGVLVIKVCDNLFEKIFQALYFPNFIVYTIILLVSNMYFLFIFIKKNVRKPFRIIGLINVLLIDILFVMILDIIVKYKIDIYNDLKIYTNKNLTVWLQLTTAIFTSMLLLYLITSAYYKVKRYDSTGVKYNYNRKLPPIIFDEIDKSEAKFTDKDKVFIFKKIRM